MGNLHIERIGKPRLVSGAPSGSVSTQNKYEIETTKLPPYPRGYNWAMCFGKHLPGGRFLAHHDHVNKITAECWPRDEAELLEAVDAAITKANEQEGNMQYEAGTVPQ